MWVSRRQFDAIERKIERLQGDHNSEKENIERIKKRLLALEAEIGFFGMEKTWTPRQAIEAILKHLGITLEEGPAWEAKKGVPDEAQPFGAPHKFG